MSALLAALGWLAAPLALPWALALAGSPARAGWFGRVRARLGFVSPQVEVGAVVVHGASHGEARSVAGVIAALRAHDVPGAPPSFETIRTAVREAALAPLVEGDADERLPLPVDLPWTVTVWLDRVRPRAVCVVEGDLWPFLLRGCTQRGIPVRVVGAAGRTGSLRFARLFPGMARTLRWYPRDDAAGARLRVVLGDACVCGTLGDPKSRAPATRGPSPWGARPAWIAACTHPGEEDLVLDAWGACAAGDALLVLAPRDVGRAGAVARAAAARGFRVGRASRQGAERVDVWVLDRMGGLAGLYAHACGAFIGGTLVPVGDGHSPAEARAARVRVARGPNARGPAWSLAGAVEVVSAPDLARFVEDCLRGGGVTGGAEPPPSHESAEDAWWELHAQLAAAPVPPEATLRPWLLPLAALWALGSALHARRAAPRVDVPVIAVGGLAAGGTGKTPAAAWIAGVLAAFDPLVVARGYGRDRGGDVRLTGEAGVLGDELAMLARRGVRVASAPDRRAGILRAREVAPVGVAVLDDGWTTRSVRADLHVLLVDARHPTAGGLIPAGGRRLPLAALARADVCVTMHGALPDALAARLSPGCVSARAELVPIGWLHRGALHPLGALEGRRVVALVGIARPAAFLSTLRQLGHRPDRTWVLPDHHRGTWRQLQAMEAWRDTHAVVTTEKDAARLPPDAPVWALRVELRFLEGEDAVRERLRAVVGA